MKLPKNAYALLAAVLFGLPNPLGKIINQQVHWLVYAFLLCALGAFFSIGSLVLRRQPISLSSKRLPEYLGLGVVGLALPVALSGYSYTLAPSINVGLLLRMEALFAVLYGVWFFRERLSGIQWAGIITGLVGATAFSTKLSGSIGIAEATVIFASGLFGTYLLFVKRLEQDHDPITLVGIRCTVAALVLAPFALPQLTQNIPWLETAVFAFLVFFAGTIAYTASVARLGLWRTAAIGQFFSGVLAILSGMVWLNETFSVVEWLGGALVLIGGAVVLIYKK